MICWKLILVSNAFFHNYIVRVYYLFFIFLLVCHLHLCLLYNCYENGKRLRTKSKGDVNSVRNEPQNPQQRVVECPKIPKYSDLGRSTQNPCLAEKKTQQRS